MVLLSVTGYLVLHYITGGTGGTGCRVVSGQDDGTAYEFTPEQAVNAATITAVGTARGLPERAVTIALATALQESALRNIDHGDRDSLGLFQQRPSQGWGTEKQIMDPTYAAGKFYEHLVKVPDYTRLPLTVAAQRVQRSGFPDAYAKHEPDAGLLAAALTGRSAATLTCSGRPGATPAEGTEAVRSALARDFGSDGRDGLEPAGAVVGEAASSAPAPSPSVENGGRALTLPVADYSDGGTGRSLTQRGWQLAHWAVANASSLHIERVSYAGQVWTAGNTDGPWQPAADAGTAGAETGAADSVDAVQVVTAQ
uniref:heavy metal transporter n=1 Tax=Streptomyces blattellae TaxID=2569855 RepID=UPI0038B514A8